MKTVQKTLYAVFALMLFFSCNRKKDNPPATAPKKEITSLDLVVRNDKTKTEIKCSMINDPKSDTVILKGTATNYDKTVSHPVTLFLPKAEMAKVKMKDESATESVFLDGAGAATKYKLTNMMVTDSLDKKFQIYTGKYLDDAGNESSYTAITDPVPAVVIVAAIGAGACVLIIGIEKLTQDCLKELETAINACKEKGGLPQVDASVYFGMSLSPFKVGCGATCTLNCLPGTK